MKNNNNIVVTNGTVDEFFSRVKKLAQQIDRGEILESSHTITFEDPNDMIKFLSPKKMAVIKAIKSHPANTITDLARFVERNRSSVSKDIKEMVKFGIVTIENKINPGHGQSKIVNLAFPKLTLQAVF